MTPAEELELLELELELGGESRGGVAPKQKQVITKFDPYAMKAEYGAEKPVSEMTTGELASAGAGGRMIEISNALRELMPKFMQGKELPVGESDATKLKDIRQTTPGMLGGALPDVVLSAAPISKAASVAKTLAPVRTMIAPVAGAATGTAGYYGATTPGSAEERAKAAAEAAALSMVGDVGTQTLLRTLGGAKNIIRDKYDVIRASRPEESMLYGPKSVERLTQKGVSRIADVEGGTEDLYKAAARAKEIIPGAAPTMKEAIAQYNIELAKKGKPRIGAETVSLQDELAGIPGVGRALGQKADIQERAFGEFSKKSEKAEAGELDKVAAEKEALIRALSERKAKILTGQKKADLEAMGEKAVSLRKELKTKADIKSEQMLDDVSKVAGDKKFDVTNVLSKADELKSSMSFDKDYVPTLFSKLDEVRPGKPETESYFDYAKGKTVTTTTAPKAETDFGKLRELRQSASADMRALSGKSDTASLQNKRLLGQFIKEIDDSISAGGSDIAKSYDKFRKYYSEEYAPAFREGTNVKIALKDQFGGKKIKSEDVFGEYLKKKSPTEAREYLALFGKDAGGKKMMEDAVIERYRSEVLAKGGSKRLHDKFMSEYADSLSVLEGAGIKVSDKIGKIGKGLLKTESQIKMAEKPVEKEITSLSRYKIGKELAVREEAKKLGGRVTRSQEKEVTEHGQMALPPTLSTEGMVTRFLMGKMSKGADEKVAKQISEILADPKKMKSALAKARHEELVKAIRARQTRQAGRAAGISLPALNSGD